MKENIDMSDNSLYFKCLLCKIFVMNLNVDEVFFILVFGVFCGMFRI